MAEAAVEERPSPKFYCHMCNVQFENASQNFTCPHCADGFIEELQDSPEGQDGIVDIIEDDDDSSDMEMHDLIRTSTPTDDRPSIRFRPVDRSGRSRTLTRIASTNLRQNVPFDNLIQDFIVNLGVGLNWGNAGNMGNMHLFLGNPGDYAWGREGLDAIVTQLLNQMDSAGPPPLSKDVIDALPIVDVSSDQVDSKLQCSVCWEDFVFGENVRQLPCQHVYHEPCIRPWLELHGTCPICRQNLMGGEEQQQQLGVDGGDNQEPGGSSFGGGGGGGGNDTLNVIRNIFQSQGQSSSSAFTNPTPADSSPPLNNTTSTSNNYDSQDSNGRNPPSDSMQM